MPGGGRGLPELTARRRLSRIAIICPTRASFHIGSEAETGLGGIEAANIALAVGLSGLGHDVTLYSATDRLREAHGVSNRPLSDVRLDDVDAVISSNDAGWFGKAAPSIRKVVWMHNPLPLEKALRRRQVLPILRHRPMAVFVGEVLMQRTSRLYPFRQRHQIGLGVDPLFLGKEADGPRANHFVFASQRQRGLAQVLRAWSAHGALLPPGAELHVFGTLASDMAMSDERAAQERVRFHGRVLKTELSAFYRTARAMLIPGAEDETFCLAAAEAQCMGLPVITLGIGSLRERVQDGQNGVMCRDHAAMIVAAARICRDTDLAGRLSAGALRQRALLGWPRVVETWNALLAG